MARCPECAKILDLSIEEVIKPFSCNRCHAGPLKVSRKSGYVYALGFAGYFFSALALAVGVFGVDPSEMVVHTHNAGSQGSFSALVFLAGFLVFVKVWTTYWARKFAQLW